jgi:hypothetical protein
MGSRRDMFSDDRLVSTFWTETRKISRAELEPADPNIHVNRKVKQSGG